MTFGGIEYAVPAGELDAVRRRLAEAIAWCGGRASAADPRGSTRTPAIGPDLPLLVERRRTDGTYHTEYPETTERVAAVLQVADRRARMLAWAGTPVSDPSPDLAGGRLFAFDVDGSIWDGLSEDESGGLFDVHDIPGWDMWVDLRHDGQRDVLLCWVPPMLVPAVAAGISVNCTACIEWLDRIVEARA